MKIKVENLTKSFGFTKALDNISLEFEVGNIYLLLGLNGTGKSTLFNTIRGFVLPDSGTVKIEGGGKELSYQPTSNYLPADMNLKTLIASTPLINPNFNEDKAYSLAKTFDIPLKKKFSRLSTGEKTLAQLVFALASEGKYLFLDEPTLGLDALKRELFYQELLKTYSEDRCIVLSTHLIEEAMNFASNVVIINNGKILENRSYEGLIASNWVIAGREEEVTSSIEGMRVYQTDRNGSEFIAYAEGELKKVGNVAASHLNLQKLFILKTGGRV